jgi:enoyl-CoA hydratase/carnithine racemase
MLESSSSFIEYHLDAGVFSLMINRPEKKNALLPEMYAALAAGLRWADESADVRVVLIKGTEDCFTSGNDVNGFVQNDDDKGGGRPSQDLMHALNESRKPLIAAISGLAIGIGTTLLFHCDLVYASRECFLQMPFTRLGLCPEAGSSYLLPRRIGHQRASEMLLLGERMSAEQARDYGVVNAVFEQADFAASALEKARQLASLPADSVQTSKRLIKRGSPEATREVIGQELVEFQRLLETPEAQAIVQAFLAKSAAKSAAG